MTIKRVLTIAALVGLVGVAVPATLYANGLGGMMVDIAQCMNQWMADVSYADETYNGNYGSQPDWETWRQGMSGANDDYFDCIVNAVRPNAASTFDFTFISGTGMPSGVIYRFDNSFPAGEQVYLTVYGGDVADTRFEQATITLNGTVVAAAADFSNQSDFEKAVDLGPGENELRIDTVPSEIGNMAVVIGTDHLSPPN